MYMYSRVRKHQNNSKKVLYKEKIFKKGRYLKQYFSKSKRIYLNKYLLPNSERKIKNKNNSQYKNQSSDIKMLDMNEQPYDDSIWEDEYNYNNYNNEYQYNNSQYQYNNHNTNQYNEYNYNDSLRFNTDELYFNNNSGLKIKREENLPLIKPNLLDNYEDCYYSNNNKHDFLFIKDFNNQIRTILSVLNSYSDVFFNFSPFILLSGKIFLKRYLNRTNLPKYLDGLNINELYLIACSLSEKVFMETINRIYTIEQNKILNLFITTIEFDFDIQLNEIYHEWIFINQ